jgi:AP-4 complex subunit sigma-1
MVNKQGQTRLASYYDWMSIDERSALEAEIIRKCLSRTENQCSFMEYRGMRVVYRRYASLFFIVGVEQDEEVRAVRRYVATRRSACWGRGFDGHPPPGPGRATRRTRARGRARHQFSCGGPRMSYCLPPSHSHRPPTPPLHLACPPADVQNELGMLEFIHALVETMDKYFENVCELDIMFNLEKAHFILGA